ncbi:MAG: glycosyltransferase family 4 protein [Planctomycetes bacterium]|nr:glycosyltransferase family 4 protein [Planctomycetota bacterium]
MKLCAIAKGVDIPSSRIRVHQMAPYLGRHGIELVVHPFPQSFAERRRLQAELAQADVVLVHKELPTFFKSLWLRRIRKPLVFDFDDAVFLRKRLRKGTYFSHHRMRRFKRMLSIYDAVIAGNEFLGDACRASGLPLLVAPSPVPTDVPRASERAPNAVPRIAWVGLGTNLTYLRQLAAPLRELAQRIDYRLVVISNAELDPESMGGVPIENVAWSLAGQERELAKCDVGIMPLELDSPWSKGKCAYKLLQYMAAGLPVVATNVGMNAQVVAHDESGLLVETDADWTAALERLLRDRALGLRLGSAGRARIERDFSYETIAASWAGFLHELTPTR